VETNLSLYCLTFAGGSVAPFHEWRRTQRKGLVIRPVEYPGHGARWNEAACETFQALVERIAGELRDELQPPYAFLGHSFGAIVAYELAHLIGETGSPLPARLFLSGARAPHLPGEVIHHLSQSAFLERLVEYEGMPSELLDDRDALSLLLPRVQHDFRLLEEYECRQRHPLAVPISVFGGLRDSQVRPSDLLAWTSYTSKSFRSRFFPGGHFFLFDPQFPILSNVYDDLREVLPGGTSAAPEITAQATPENRHEMFCR
jgi:medium-chain acyl-[acyl-carrier-protein] hydrolase